MGLNVQMEAPLEEGVTIIDSGPDRVFATIQSSGIRMPAGPPLVQGPTGPQPFNGEIPPDLTQLNDDQLGTLLGMLSSYMHFVSTYTARALTTLNAARNKANFTRAKIRLQNKTDVEGKKIAQAERDDHVEVDRRCLQADDELLVAEGVYELAKVTFRAAESNFNAVSRRITQRGQEIDRNNRTGNAPHQHIPQFRRPG